MELLKLHPPLVHFGIALPFALLVLDLYYRYSKREPDGLHLLLSLLASSSVVLSFISGVLAHNPIEDKLHQIHVFPLHEGLGLFLALYFIILAGLRLSFKKFSKARDIYTVGLLLGVLALFLQGSLGGAIVYDHMIRPWLEER